MPSGAGRSGRAARTGLNAYGNDDLGRRFYKQRSGSAFAAANYEVFGYNDRSELTAADQYAGTYDSGTAQPAEDDHG